MKTRKKLDKGVAVFGLFLLALLVYSFFQFDWTGKAVVLMIGFSCLVGWLSMAFSTMVEVSEPATPRHGIKLKTIGKIFFTAFVIMFIGLLVMLVLLMSDSEFNEYCGTVSGMLGVMSAVALLALVGSAVLTAVLVAACYAGKAVLFAAGALILCIACAFPEKPQR